MQENYQMHLLLSSGFDEKKVENQIKDYYNVPLFFVKSAPKQVLILL